MNEVLVVFVTKGTNCFKVEFICARNSTAIVPDFKPNYSVNLSYATLV